MSYEQRVMRRAADRLEAARTRRATDLEARRAKLYARLPRLAEIDRELRQTVAEIVSASLRSGTDPAPAIAVIRDKNMSLQKERSSLLASVGLSEHYLDETPICSKCGDTGWQGTVMCDCLKVLCTQEQIRELSKLLDLGDQSFDSFQLDYYSASPWPGWDVTPRDNMEVVYDLCLNYALKFGRFFINNLLLTGGPGLGKTFLSACIARTVSENGFSVVYDTAGNVFSCFEEKKFSRDLNSVQEAEDETRRYLNCDLLILDDLGSELTTPFVQSALYQLINTRLMRQLRTVISTNLTVDQICQRYTPQVSSRLQGEYRALPFFGEDIRLLRKRRL